MSLYTNWHAADRKPGAPFNSCSPNLRAILKYCEARWGLTNLGCYGVRRIAGSTKWSAHAFGAAQDMSYRGGPSRDIIENEVIPWFIENFEILGIQRVHDYWERRYWQAGRGWINRPPGGKNDHLHIETREDSWGWDTPIEERLTGTTPKPSETTSSSKPSSKPSAKPRARIRRGSKGKSVRALQELLADLGYMNSSGTRPIVVDGIFGAATELRVKEYQASKGLVVDGIVGPQTWGSLDNA